MNILLVNDDGYSAKGIGLLFNKLKRYGRVVIVAPEVHMSGKSCSITIGKPQKITKIDEDIYAFGGTPADCVAFGMSSLDIDFDLVVSGCNDGWNISYDINYSGTIGACLQALIYRVPAVAFSCEHNFDIVDKYFDEVFNFISKNKLLENDLILNVNFPLGEEIKDIQIGSLFYRKTKTYFKKTEEGYLGWRDIVEDTDDSKDSDCYQVEHGIVSIVPLGRTVYSNKKYEQLKKKVTSIRNIDEQI